jgi:hypothetical protein
MAFNRRTITKELDMVNLAKHNDNYADIKTELDAHDSSISSHVAAQTAHGSTSAATAGKIMQRDSSGRAKVAAPAASDDIARKAEVDAVQTNLDEHETDAAVHMSVADRSKLDGIEDGAEPNQNAFAKVNDVVASAESDALTIEGGTGITISTNPTTKKVIVTATGEATPGPHGTSHNIDGADPIPDLVTLRSDFNALTPADIGAETPAGAQAKVDALAGAENTKTVAEVADDVKGVTTQLTGNLQLMKNLFVASYHGVDSSIGTSDATDALNSLFAKAKTAGKRYVYFDEPHTYNVSGDLTNARDLIFFGCGARIESRNPKNYFIKISDGGYFNGKYNSYPEYDNLFKTAASAIKKGVVNVTIWGDSISTGGSDVLGIKRGLNNIGTTASSPTNLTPSDSYYTRLIDMLTAKFPEVTFNFYNRAVGGANIQATDSDQTFNGVTKNWMAHVKDTNPDLLIIAFGMNTYLALSQSFRYSMDRIMNYINANFTAKYPSIAWITTPRPTLALDDEWGGFDEQLSRHMAAYCTRYSGMLKGGYIIDVNRVSDILRTGTDFTRPILKSVDLTGKISGTYAESGGVYTMDAEGETLFIDEIASDFVLEFEVNFGTVSGGNLWFGYNRFSNMESLLLILPNLSSVGGVHSYANYADAQHFPSGTMVFNSEDAWNDGAWRKFRIEKRAEILEVYVDGLRVIRDITAINNLPGTIHMDMNGTGAAVYQIRNIKMYKAEYRQYVPSLTEEEMYGPHVYGDYTTKPGIGGNGVNHPSTIGLEEAYCTALSEFVEDISASRWKALL